MAYDFKYRLQEPTARTDGSGQVDHQTEAIYDVGGDVWEQVPWHNKTIVVPAEELEAVLDMSNGQAKVTAYKNLLAANLFAQPEPVTGWSSAQMTLMLDNNAASVAQLERFVSWVVDDLGLSFPVSFSM